MKVAAVGVTICLFLTGLLKAINLLLLLAYLLFGLLAANMFLARKLVRGLQARRLPPGPVFAGQPAPWSVEITNPSTKIVRGWSLEDSGPSHRLAWFVARLEAGKSVDVRATVTLARRGRYQCAPLRARTSYPFGMVEHSADLEAGDSIIVLPRLGTVHGDRLRQWLARASRGDGRVRRRIRHIAAQEADVHGLRAFRPGDSPRRIHWKTSARRNEWMVREFEDSAPPHLVLVVEPWMPTAPTARDSDRLERIISLAGSVCREWCRELGARLTLVLARAGPAVVDGSTGGEHALRLLNALAMEEGGVDCDPSEWLPVLGPIAGSPVLVLSTRSGGHLASQLAGALSRPVASCGPEDYHPWYNAPDESSPSSTAAGSRNR